MKKLIFILGLLITGSAFAQSTNTMCPTRPPGDSTNACSSTAFINDVTSGIFSLPHNWLAPQTFPKVFINTTSDNGPFNVQAPTTIPVIGYFSNIGGADSTAAWLVLRDAYTGSRSAGAAGDGNGGIFSFQSLNSIGTVRDGLILNGGLIKATNGAEQSDFDISGYRNGAVQILTALDAQRPAYIPGTDAIWSLGDLNTGVGHSQLRWLNGYFSGKIGIGVTAAPTDPLTITQSAGTNLGVYQNTANSYVRLFPSATAGSYNASVQLNDNALIFSGTAADTGGLVIAPFSTTSHGLRMDGATGNTTLYGGFIASTNTSTSIPTPPEGGSIIHVVGTDTVEAGILVDSFANYGQLEFRRANGTNAAKTALLNGDTIFAIESYGYGTTGYSAAASSQIIGSASENWSDTAHGTLLSFYTTPNTTVTPQRRVVVWQSGQVSINNNVVPPTGVLLDVTGAVKIDTITVATLPTCNAAAAGSIATVFDGTAALAWGATVTGGATTYYTVNCNGTNWTVMGK